MKAMIVRWFPLFCLFNAAMAIATDAGQTISAVMGWLVAAALSQERKYEREEQIK